MPITLPQRINLCVAWVLTIVMLLGTLFSSEILQMAVCNLCWYQRICVYPLVLILGIACYRDENVVIPYVIGLPVIGAGFALYQTLEQTFPRFAPINLCGTGPSCADVGFKLFGFLTFPLMSFMASVLLFILLWLARPAQ